MMFLKSSNLAFEEKHDPESAPPRVTNNPLLAADAGKRSALFLVDLSSAFDTVDNRTLSCSLKDIIGLTDTALKCFIFYLSLSDRQFQSLLVTSHHLLPLCTTEYRKALS